MPLLYFWCFFCNDAPIDPGMSQISNYACFVKKMWKKDNHGDLQTNLAQRVLEKSWEHTNLYILFFCLSSGGIIKGSLCYINAAPYNFIIKRIHQLGTILVNVNEYIITMLYSNENPPICRQTADLVLVLEKMENMSGKERVPKKSWQIIYFWWL